MLVALVVKAFCINFLSVLGQYMPGSMPILFYLSLCRSLSVIVSRIHFFGTSACLALYSHIGWEMPLSYGLWHSLVAFLSAICLSDDHSTRHFWELKISEAFVVTIKAAWLHTTITIHRNLSIHPFVLIDSTSIGCIPVSFVGGLSYLLSGSILHPHSAPGWDHLPVLHPVLSAGH